MRKDAVFDQFDIFVYAAIIASQSTAGPDGFRQKDVRFFIELFSNWLSSTLDASHLMIHNTQIKRYLDDLTNDGHAKKSKKKGPPSYNLTQLGLLEILAHLTGKNYVKRMEHFFFLYHFIETYGDYLQGMVKQKKGGKFDLIVPDLNYLLDINKILAEQISLVEREIDRLERRIEKSIQSSMLAKKLSSEGMPLDQVVKKVQETHPYELRNQRPLSEVYSTLPKEIQKMEVEIVPERRGKRLWTPMLELYRSYHKILLSMRNF